ncbi:beta-N-acetylhexosaminidase [Motilibacter peucedani]|uniref:Beta-N-acetylhexosaminidase n=1 Tax=Motilibacter peucedani TaxID=598650 RepID=A0A420XL85_9ACTN|nr:glycoside hydrolase family 3 N-terminal domain-containing protein [Motilibacter peucedani]RKS69369.1 beta-N-acetylhexosaminidase [Motilibacter peucedani]
MADDLELRRLAARVVMGAFEGLELPAWTADLLADGLGSLCLFGSNVESPEQLAALTAAIRAVAPDVLLATDEEGGDVTRLHMRTGNPHPGNAALGSADDVDLTSAVATAIGAELRAAGIDLDLAPVVDVNSNPHNPVIGVRSFGADAALVARHSAAYVSGLQAAGVAACVKHWPGHGDTALDSHLAMPTVDAPLEVLRARELVPFAAAVEAGTLAVMTSHVLLPAIDPDAPATLSPAVVRLLREDLGFDGLLVSDALDMKGASGGRGEPAAAVLAVAAGCDLLCLGADKELGVHEAVIGALVAAVQDGTLPEARLREAAGRVSALSARLRAGAGEPVPHPDPEVDTKAARRGVRVTGSFPPVQGAVVLRFVTGTNIAVGEVPWGLPADADALRGGAQVDVAETDAVEPLLPRAEGAPLVALVREPHRRPWVERALHALAAARPDLVVVELGWPGPEPLPGAAVVHSYGASLSNAAAVAAVLAEGVAG